MSCRIAVFEDLPSGGARRALFEMLRRMNRSYDIDLFSLSSTENHFCRLDNLVNKSRIFQFQPSRLFKSPFGRLNQAQRIRDLRTLDRLGSQIAVSIDNDEYKLVFAHHCRWTQAPLLLRHLKTPSIYFCQEIPRPLYEEPYRFEDQNSGLRALADKVDPLLFSYRKLAKGYDADAVRSATLVLVNSVFSQKTVQTTYGVSPEVSYLGVNTDRFKPSQDSRKDYLISVGAIHPRKGFDFLIRSIASLPLEKRLPLVLIGDSELPGERETLVELASALGVELTIEVGISDENLIAHYQRAKLMLYSPHNEPFGLAPLEAMACGLAVLAVDEGGVQETIEEQVTGMRVERNSKRFSEVLSQLIESPEILETWGIQGHELVTSKWTWNKSVERIERHFRSVLNSHD